MDDNNEIRRQKLAAIFRWGLGLVGAAIISPVVFLAVKGIVGLALAVGIGFAVIQLAPVVAMKLANWRMKLIIDEAEKNPIETLRNETLDAAKAIDSKDQELEDWDTELRTYDDELVSIKRDYPDEAASFERVSEEMHTGLTQAREEQQRARWDLEEAKRTVDKMERLYKMALAAQRVKSFSKTAEEAVMADIRQKAAMDSVRTNLNRSLSQLNTAMAKRAARPALTVAGMGRQALGAGRPATIDMSTDANPAKVPVPRVRDKE